VYSTLGFTVSPRSEYKWNKPNYWSPQCLAAPPASKRSWTNRGKIVDTWYTHLSRKLRGHWTECHKILYNIGKWLQINVYLATYANFCQVSLPYRGNSYKLSPRHHRVYWTEVHQFLARDVIYTFHAYPTMLVSVCLSVCPSVCDGSALWSRCMPGRGEGSSRAMLAAARPSCYTM